MTCDFCRGLTDQMHVERRVRLVRRRDGLDPSVVIYCDECAPDDFGVSTPWLVLGLAFVMCHTDAELVAYINDKLKWAHSIGNGVDRTLAAMKDAREAWISRN